MRGTPERVGYNDGLHPWRNQYLPSVRQWRVDASLFRIISVTERAVLRFNADFFNVFNMPGNPNSGSGIRSLRWSGRAGIINFSDDVRLHLRVHL